MIYLELSRVERFDNGVPTVASGMRWMKGERRRGRVRKWGWPNQRKHYLVACADGCFVGDESSWKSESNLGWLQ